MTPGVSLVWVSHKKQGQTTPKAYHLTIPGGSASQCSLVIKVERGWYGTAWAVRCAGAGIVNSHPLAGTDPESLQRQAIEIVRGALDHWQVALPEKTW